MNISALLGALKKNESDGKNKISDSFGGDDGEPIAAKVSVLKAKPMDEPDDEPGMFDDPGDDMPMGDDEPGMFGDPGDDMPMGDDDMGEEQDEAEDEDQIKDAKISAILQTRFPEIYKQIEAQLESGDDDDNGGAQS